MRVLETKQGLLWVLLALASNAAGCGEPTAQTDGGRDADATDGDGDQDADQDVDQDGDEDVDPDADDDADEPPPLDLFDPDHVLQIEIELDPEDWEQLRHQQRTVLDVFGGEDCLEGPIGSPFTWFRATVSVDGATVRDAAIRKKGLLGSLSEDKPGLRLDFDHYVDGQRLHGSERMTLNNSASDPSYVNQCIGYGLFAAAGIPSPRCSFAHVTVNGVDLGIYVHVEAVRKPFLGRHFENRTGNLYEGTLADFRDGWSRAFELETNDDAPAEYRDVDAVVAALAAEDAAVISEIERVVDLDGFYTFWAMEVLVAHVDGYAGNANNFFVYNDPTTRSFHFIPWGIDAILASGNWLDDQGHPPAAYVTGALANRLYALDEGRVAYESRMRELLETVWDADAILQEIDRIERLLAPLLSEEERRDRFEPALGAAREFVAGRRAAMEAALAGPPVIVPELRGPPCMTEVGTLSGSFSTTWGSHGAPDPFAAGAGTLELILEGTAIPVVLVGSTAGVDPAVPSSPAALTLVALREDGLALVVAVTSWIGAFEPGAVLDFGSGQAQGWVVEFDPAAPDAARFVGMLVTGALRLEEASTTPGARVSGTIDAVLYDLPF